MRPIGGELESKALKELIYFTDTGRSSLRLFIRSGNKDKKFLIPNFLCAVIENVLVEEDISYEFYNITNNLELDIDSIKNKDYDVFYYINYFGSLLDLSNLELSDKIVVEDNVFLNDFENRYDFKKWYAFNSFRKISSLSDGSLIKTNMLINEALIINEKANFVDYKNKAKNLKYDYINNHLGDEMSYLNEFNFAEKIIDEKKEINKISNESLYKILSQDFSNEQEVSKVRFEKFKKIFPNLCLNENPIYYSFFVLKIQSNEKLKKYLMSKNIFLAIHWPKSTQDNCLYDKVISVPLFSAYNEKGFNRLVEVLQEYYND